MPSLHDPSKSTERGDAWRLGRTPFMSRPLASKECAAAAFSINVSSCCGKEALISSKSARGIARTTTSVREGSGQLFWSLPACEVRRANAGGELRCLGGGGRGQGWAGPTAALGKCQLRTKARFGDIARAWRLARGVRAPAAGVGVFLVLRYFGVVTIARRWRCGLHEAVFGSGQRSTKFGRILLNCGIGWLVRGCRSLHIERSGAPSVH